MKRRDQKARPPGRPPAEGVRIIGAEEAQAALDAGEVAGRRPDDELRFGDVPPAPTGPRPTHRFPLPDSVDPATAVPLPPLAGRGRDDEGFEVARGSGEEAAWDIGERTGELGVPSSAGSHWSAFEVGAEGAEAARSVGRGAPSEPIEEWSPTRAADEWRAARIPSAGTRVQTEREAQAGPTESTAGTGGGEKEIQQMTLPEDGLTVTGAPTGLPHWTDPPTGEVPRILLGEEGQQDMDAWNALGSRGIRWRDSDDDWEDADELAAFGEEGVSQPVSEESDLYSFDEDFERLQASRSGPVPVISPEAYEPDPGDVTQTGAFIQLDEPGDVDDLAGAGEPTYVGAGVAHDARFDDDFSPSFDDEDGDLVTAAVPAPRGRNRHGPTRTRTRRQPVRTPARPRTRAPAGGADVDNLTDRVVIGAAFIVLLIVAYAIGSKALVVLAAAILTACAAEAYSMLQRSGFRPATLLGLVATTGVVLGAYWKGIDAIPVGMVLVFVGSMLWYLLRIVEARPLANVAVSSMTFVWIGVLGGFSGVLLRAHDGRGLLLGTIVVTVVADIAAFLVGRWIGSRPLAAEISPGKTAEGFAGGLVAAIIAGAIIGKELAPWGGMKHGLVLGVVIGLVAPLGDLFESMMKRDLGIKDSGRVLRAHGGVLDRFDSMLIALPAAYYVAWLFSLVH